ncbi:MAG: acyl-ACP desaturase [Actinomycetota bacterium]|nr:acyl-ACP desaturase [Actinomycetota bacterium]
MTATAESLELVSSVEPEISRLMGEHRKRRQHWYAHEVVPWEQGRSFRDEPWDESQATLSPEVRTALQLNLLTEDNLPYYHAKIAGSFAEDSPMAEWSRLWTAEEGQHSIAIRNYLLASRNCDPAQLEDERLATVTKGWSYGAPCPIEIFAYTSAQELATRISHRNAGVKADCPVAHEVMTRVAVDENHHFMFYRGVTTAMLREAPGLVLEAIHAALADFRMPGTGIPNFNRRAVAIARAGIYNLRIHAEQVLQPLLRHWKIESLVGLDARASELQAKILAIPATLITQAEAFEARLTRRGSKAAAGA